MRVERTPKKAAADDGALVTKAVLKAGARLGLSSRALSRILGVSEATVSRMNSGSFVLAGGDKSFELALMFVRMFRSLDAIVAGDDEAARRWLANENIALGGVPREMIQSLPGLVHIVGYLDARRALV